MLTPIRSHTPDGRDGPQDGFAFGAPAYAWFVVAVLCALQIASNMDRQIINLLVEQIRRDLGVSDVGVSLLQGLAFAVFYSVVAVPIGWASDRTQRRMIIIVGVVFWSFSTLMCMVAKDYTMLFVARMMVGLGEAALIPAAFSMLSDYFPKARLSSAISAVTGASFLGSGLALAVGGFILARLPTTGQVDLPFVGPVFGWQLAFGVVTLPSLVMVAVMAFVREPPRRETGKRQAGVRVSEMVAFIAHNGRFWAALVSGMALLNIYQMGLSTWTVTFFLRTYGWSAERIGVLYGGYFMVIGTAASLAGGMLCDWIVARGRHDANLIIPLGAAIISLPLTALFALNGDATVSAVLLALLTFVGVLPFGPGIAAVPLLAPNRMRAQLLAVYMLIMTLLGAVAGPWLIAAATDYLFKDPMALKYSIALVGSLVLGAAVICLVLGSLGMRHFRPEYGPEGEPPAVPV